MDTFLHVVASNAVVAAGLAVVALAVGLTVRRPALTHALWLLVLLKLLTPPLYPVHLSWLTPPDPAPVASAGPETEEPAATELDEEPPALAGTLAEAEGEPQVALALVPHEEEELATAAPALQLPAPGPWLPTLLVVWLIGSLVWFALAVGRVLRFRRLLRHARPAPPALQNQVKRLARRLGLIRCPEMLVVPGRVAPLLWAWGCAPCLVVPEGLLAQVNGAQRATLLSHELAHLRRGDHWVRFLEFLAMGLCWWHPAVWLARRELREAEEQCCDAWVVWALPGAGRDYATALVETLDFLAEPAPAAPLLASGIGPVTDLKRRLTMIMRGTTPRSLTWGGVLTVLSLAALLLPVLPTWAQKPKEAEEEEQGRRFRIAVLDGDADLQKAQAELQRLEAELKAKTAEIKAAQEKMRSAAEQLKKATMEKERARAVAEREKARASAEEGRARARVVRGKEGEEAKGGGVIHIEVIVSKDAKDVDVKKLTSDIQKAVQGVGGKVIVNVSDGQPGQKRVRVIENKIEAADGKKHVIVKPDVEFRFTPMKPGEKKPEPKKPGADAAPKGRTDDGRLEKLEKRLDELIRELDQMRREIRRPSRSGAAVNPTAPATALAPAVGLVPPTPAAPSPAPVALPPAAPGAPPAVLPPATPAPGAPPAPLPPATPAVGR